MSGFLYSSSFFSCPSSLAPCWVFADLSPQHRRGIPGHKVPLVNSKCLYLRVIYLLAKDKASLVGFFAFFESLERHGGRTKNIQMSSVAFCAVISTSGWERNPLFLSVQHTIRIKTLVFHPQHQNKRNEQVLLCPFLLFVTTMLLLTRYLLKVFLNRTTPFILSKLMSTFKMASRLSR